MLRKHACHYGSTYRGACKWDQYPTIVGIQKTPHETTGEKPLFSMDCRSPTEVELLPPLNRDETDITAYQEDLTESLSLASNLDAETIRKVKLCASCSMTVQKWSVGVD